MASNYYPSMQRKLEAPMPSIGIYVAVASLACALLMAADLIHGLRSKRLWFPSKFFSLNATSLALLSVALKLPTDLTTNMSAVTDRLAKISSLALITTAMATTMPSLGSMTDSGILINITALSLLIITVLADVCIQLTDTRSFLHHRLFFVEEILALILMFLLLVVNGSTATMVLTTKKLLQAKYNEKCSSAASSGELWDTIDNRRSLVKKYWVMAETGNPQFVIARSPASAASGFICLAIALILAQVIVRAVVVHGTLSLTDSSYGGSTQWILIAQTVSVILGSISTCFRWGIAVRFRLRCSSGEVDRSLKLEMFKVEDYWTRKLMEWQGSSIPTIIKHRKCRRFVYNARGVVVDFIRRSQIVVVVFNKLLLVISCFITAAFIKLIQNLKKLWVSSADSVQREVGREFLQDVRNSIRLEGEADLPECILQSIPKHVDEVLQAAREQKSAGLFEFLRYSNFRGVAEFDNYQVPRIHDNEPQNCWSLAVTTLTTIATALPNVQESRVEQLVRNVGDGLIFVEAVEKSFYKNEELENIRQAVDFWYQVIFDGKWQKIDLASICSASRTSRQALEILVDKSRNMALEKKIPDCPMFSPANWPTKTIAANSMYRMSSTILDSCDEENPPKDEELFERISAMIAGILAACLTNLGRVIAKKCHVKAIEDRERSVFEAARLLGKGEDIVDLLVNRDLPARLNPDRAEYIEEWRRATFPEIEMSSYAITPSCDVGTVSSQGSGSCLNAAIMMEHVQRSFQREDLQL